MATDRRRAGTVRAVAVGLGLSLTLGIGAAAAESWTRLDTGDIEAALTARSVVFDNAAIQEFRADGTTTYDSGAGTSRGVWRATDDEYCSRWPPSDDWVCYNVERSAGGLDLRFTATGGGFSVARYNDLK